VSRRIVGIQVSQRAFSGMALIENRDQTYPIPAGIPLPHSFIPGDLFY
jgi:hypothetical protein